MNLKAIVLVVWSTLFVFQVEGYWTGYYSGFNSGVGVGYANAQLISGSSLSSYFGAEEIQSIASHGNFNLSKPFYIGGLQAGYNYTPHNVLIGLETDFGFFLFRKSQTVPVVYPVNAPASYTIYQQVGTDWLYTLRPRIGYTWNCLLAFVTGGLAVTNLKYRETLTDDYYTLFPSPPGENAYQQLAFNEVKVGWTVGCGIEYILNWKASLEISYLYTRFNRITNSNTLIVQYGGLEYNNPMTGSTDLYTNLFRIALNWKIY